MKTDEEILCENRFCLCNKKITARNNAKLPCSSAKLMKAFVTQFETFGESLESNFRHWQNLVSHAWPKFSKSVSTNHAKRIQLIFQENSTVREILRRHFEMCKNDVIIMGENSSIEEESSTSKPPASKLSSDLQDTANKLAGISNL